MFFDSFFDNYFNKIQDNFDKIQKHFDEMMKDNSSNNFNYVKKTYKIYPQSKTLYICPKCGAPKMTGKHVQVDSIRDCLYFKCAGCNYSMTCRTKDNPGKFDLPTVEEAVAALKAVGH